MGKILIQCPKNLKGAIELDTIFIIEQKREERHLRKINQKIDNIKEHLSIF